MQDKKIKICLYLEFYNFLGGMLFKNIGTGLLSSYKNQKIMLRRLNIPFVERWDDSCDILQINTPWIKSIYLMKKAKRLNKKVVVWAHVTVEDAMQVFRFMPLVAPIFKKYLIYAYDLADLIFCPSEYTKSLLLAYGIAEKKLAVESNAVDTDKFYENAGLKESGRRAYGFKNLTIGTIGLAIPRKGIGTFLNLARKFPENQFIWFGKIYSSFLVKPIPKNISTNAKFAGYIDDAKINEAYNSLDIFIFPSYEENQGMAILEASAVGLPILVRDIPVYRGWLVHGQNCFKAKNDEEFETHLKKLLTDDILRKKLGQAAKVLAQSESAGALADKLFSVYNRL